MKIHIEPTNGKSIKIGLPTPLALNSVTVGILSGILKKHDIPLQRQTLMALKRDIKRYKRRHKDWYLLEVTSADGTCVLIKV